MNRLSTRTRRGVCFGLTLTLLGACAWVDHKRALTQATDLAVSCNIDEALTALDTAEQGGKFAQALAGLERIAILRDVGRDDEAERALEAFRQRTSEDTWTEQDIEESVGEFLDGIREDRLDETGSATCPA